MAERFSMDASDAHAVGHRLASDGDALQAAHARLSALMDGLHGCWGTDDYGRSFSKDFVPQMEDFRANLATTTENLPSVAKAIEDIVDEFESIDEDNAARIRQLDERQADNIREWSKEE